MCAEVGEGMWALAVLVLREFQTVFLENTGVSGKKRVKAFF